MLASILSMTDELGIALGEYHYPWKGPLLAWSGGFLGTALCIWLAARSPRDAWAVLGIFAFLGLVAVAVTCKALYKAHAHRIMLFERGLLHLRRGKHEIYRWDALESVWLQPYNNLGVVTLELHLQREDGVELNIEAIFITRPRSSAHAGAVKRLTYFELVNRVDRLFQPYRIQRTITRYEDGETLDFQVFALDQNGIAAADRSLAWGELADIDEHDGSLRFLQRGALDPWLTLPRRAIDIDVELLAALMKHIRGTHDSIVRTGGRPVPLLASLPVRRPKTAFSWIAVIVLIGLLWSHSTYKRAQSSYGQTEHAIHLYSDQRYADSITVLDAVIERNPVYTRANVHRGRAYQKLHRYDLAVRDYETALARNPDYWYALYNRGRLRDETGQFAAALRDYDQAVAANPDFDYVYYKRGHLQRKLGNTAQAIADFERYLSFKPTLNQAEVEALLVELRR